MKKELRIAGMGLSYPRQATLEVLEAISGCDVVFSNLSGEGASNFLSLFCPDVRYVSYENRKNEIRIAQKIFTAFNKSERVGFVTRGNPMVSGGLIKRLLKEAKKRGVAVRAFPAVSTMDAVLAASGEIFQQTFWGMQMFDSRLLTRAGLRPDPRLHAIICLALTVNENIRETPRLLARELPEALKEKYGANYVLYVFGPRYDLARLKPVMLRDLPRMLRGCDARVIPSLTLFLPAQRAFRLRLP